MSHAAKQVLLLLLSVGIGVLSSWLVASHYENSWVFWLVAACLAATVIAQVALALFIRSKEEEHIQLIHDLRQRNMTSRAATRTQIDERIRAEVKDGNLEGAVEWAKRRGDLL